VGGGDGWYVRLKHTALAVRLVSSCAGVVGAAMARLARTSGMSVENFMVVVGWVMRIAVVFLFERDGMRKDERRAGAFIYLRTGT
jgi:hypothetical protein